MPFFRAFSFPDNESNGKTERKSIRTENGRTRIADIAMVRFLCPVIQWIIKGKQYKQLYFFFNLNP